MKRLLLVVSALIALGSLFPRCAKVVSPAGGPKDTLAPVMVRSVPNLKAVNFKGNRLVLTFDEYVQLKEIYQKLIVSPPFKKKPVVNLRGKSVEISFSDTLKHETTYTFYFSDAIVDNNENNPLKNFQFTFSTGSSIDSLTLSGTVVHSFTLEPTEGVLVMLYDSFSDSLPYLQLPNYVSRTDKMGAFTLSNLKQADYKVFAILDGNSNYLFDQVSEDIAFQKAPIRKEQLAKPIGQKDTIRTKPASIKLSLFREESQIHALVGSSRDARRRVQLSFSNRQAQEVKVMPLGLESIKNWYLLEPDANHDTLVYWITDDRISSIDSLKLVVRYAKTDSLKRLIPAVDTLNLLYRDAEASARRKRQKEKEEEKPVSFVMSSSIKNGESVPIAKPLTLGMPVPIKSIDKSKYRLLDLTDSTEISTISFLRDSINPRLFSYSNAWKANVAYRFEALPGAFLNLDDVANDTLKISFRGADPENFGILIISVANVKKAAIVELLDEKGKLVERKRVSPSQKAKFTFIPAGKYQVRIIEDINMNGIWDPGTYLKNIQPERVFKFLEGKSKGIIEVRANWENEITFTIPN